MRKLVSFVVCCYNSQDYMKKCLESLLLGGEKVEIIVIDDGSKDDTAKIADSYQEKYPSIIRVVHQENGGDLFTGNVRRAAGDPAALL